METLNQDEREIISLVQQSSYAEISEILLFQGKRKGKVHRARENIRLYGFGSMTEEEILISAFFDNELEGAEKKAAENLIANNSKAYEYFQSLKVIDNELNSFTEDSLLSNKLKRLFKE